MMVSTPAQEPLQAADLPPAWCGKSAWRVLDTAFGDGRLFFDTWRAWAADPLRPRLLHYVAITPVAPDWDLLSRTLAAYPSLAADPAGLRRQWFGLLPGFHRMFVHGGQVLLTLCIGPLQAMLREQQFVADRIDLCAPVAEPPWEAWDRWSTKVVTRLCRRGTSIRLRNPATGLRGELAQAGFVFEDPVRCPASGQACDHAVAGLAGQYQPSWQMPATRHAWRSAPSPISSCAVVGAGLAGATVAAALARRGWQVTVLDAASQAATGASGLPVGLLAPQVSRDGSARSRLSRAGVRATLALCHALLQYGEDWACPGVLELRPDGSPGLPDHWPAEGSPWSQARQPDAAGGAWSQGLAHGSASIWHSHAAWIKPARLVQACLAQAGVSFVSQSEVRTIVRESGQWLLLDGGGAVLARAPHMVVAGAGNSVQLLAQAADAEPQVAAHTGRLAVMAAVSGQVSWALQQGGEVAALPPFPVNGHGSFVGHVPMDGAPAWFAGATYEPGSSHERNAATGHRENLDRLGLLLPATAAALAQRFKQAQVNAWTGTRCTTIDRLPAAGPLCAGPQPSLWVSTGMGSRGLTYAALCAELIAAQLCGEPLPVEASLAKSIAATRAQLLHHL